MTKIEWTEKTWNPIVGCSIVMVVSDGHDIVLGAADDEKAGPRRIWSHYGGWQGHLVKYVQEKSACRLLDGREWNEMPGQKVQENAS